MAVHALSIPTTGTQQPLQNTGAGAHRAQLETAIANLLDTVEDLVAQLDALDGDPDVEFQCDDEGFECDREPDFYG